MKTILIKDNHLTRTSTLANPFAKLGKQNDAVTIKAIHNIPDDFSTIRLIQLWSQTCVLTWLKKEGNYLERGRFDFDFSELGAGKIIMS